MVELSDAAILAAVRPLYGDQTAADMGAEDDLRIARAVLAAAQGEAEPKKPSDDELGLIYHDCCRGCEFMDQVGFEDAARAVLARWGRPAQPAVAEQPSDEELIDFQNEWFQSGRTEIDVTEFQRATLSRWGQPPAPPTEGEVAELARWLRLRNPIDMEGEPDDCTYFKLTRAAELLERHAAPVPAAERPWQRQGWCDKEGRFWAEHIGRSGVASWRFAAASDLGGWAFRCLPFHALPLPQGGEVEP